MKCGRRRISLNNFKVIALDTDSLFFKKEDESLFSDKEQEDLINELNNLCPSLIHWELNGFFPKIITLKTKNYVLYDGKKIKIKGSGLRDQKSEPALREFTDSIIQTIIDEKYEYVSIYNAYIKEACNVTDMKRWCSKKTISDKVLNAERTNEQKVLDVIQDTEYVEGDKIFTYYKKDNSLGLLEKFDGDYNEEKLIKKVFQKTKIFDNIITKGTFVDYSLKRNREDLEKLLD